MGEPRYEVRHSLPEDVALFVAGLRDRELNDQITLDQVYGYLLELSNAGWTFRALANAYNGVVIDTVRKPVVELRDSGRRWDPIPDAPPIPESPRREAQNRPAQPSAASQTYHVPEEVAERMKKLYRLAKEVRGTTPQDSPKREASKELSRMMATEKDAGASFVEIGKAVGMSWSAVKFRLGRYGYYDLPASVAHTLVEDIGGHSPQPRSKSQEHAMEGKQ